MSDMIKVSICDGKYTIIQDASGRTNVLRYGESWRDVTGDNVVLGAAYEIDKLQSRIKRLEKDLSDAYAEMRKQHPAITAVFDNSVWTKAKENKQ